MKLNGQLYAQMAESAFHMLERHREKINQMNVFPVPDGDTGTNMSLTVSTVGSVSKGLPLGECAERVAALALYSARGNSGAIFSLFFRGVAKHFEGKEEADAKELAAALSHGTKEAYRAVMKPAEGTILTVMREVSEAAKIFTENGHAELPALFDHIVSVAEETLAKTPEMLPVLKEAGVVDAGGYGFVVCLKGMRAAVSGEPILGEESVTPDMEVAASFADFSAEDIPFSYCTECIVQKNEEYLGEDTACALRAFAESVGDSVVLIDDERLIKLHIHTNDPGAVLSHAITYGMLLSVKVENMRKQHTALAEGTKDAVSVAKEGQTVAVPIEKKYGFVSVCMGEGIKAAFLDVGVDTVIEGGQTMNPSTQNILDAVMKTPAQTVFVLPNNKNVRMVARQAAELASDRRVVVIPTETVPQGISAMLAYDPDAALAEAELADAMTDAYRGVTTMAVTYAVRDTSVGRFRIAKGQYLGLVENTIACVSKSSFDCAEQLIRGMTDAAFVTVFYGENVEEAIADRFGAHIRERINGCEVTVISGGQGVYDYIISVE